MSKKEFEGKTTRNGTWLQVWVNDDYIGEIESFKAEVNLTYTDVNKARSLMADKKLTKIDGKISIKTHKTRDSLQKYIIDQVKAGKMPIFSIVGAEGGLQQVLSKQSYHDGRRGRKAC